MKIGKIRPASFPATLCRFIIFDIDVFKYFGTVLIVDSVSRISAVCSVMFNFNTGSFGHRNHTINGFPRAFSVIILCIDIFNTGTNRTFTVKPYAVCFFSLLIFETTDFHSIFQISPWEWIIDKRVDRRVVKYRNPFRSDAGSTE